MENRSRNLLWSPHGCTHSQTKFNFEKYGGAICSELIVLNVDNKTLRILTTMFFKWFSMLSCHLLFVVHILLHKTDSYERSETKTNSIKFSTRSLDTYLLYVQHGIRVDGRYQKPRGRKTIVHCQDSHALDPYDDYNYFHPLRKT
jgi:hypothetical protein